MGSSLDAPIFAHSSMPTLSRSEAKALEDVAAYLTLFRSLSTLLLILPWLGNTVGELSISIETLRCAV